MEIELFAFGNFVRFCRAVCIYKQKQISDKILKPGVEIIEYLTSSTKRIG